jgi:hypothetical protein
MKQLKLIDFVNGVCFYINKHKKIKLIDYKKFIINKKKKSYLMNEEILISTYS